MIAAGVMFTFGIWIGSVAYLRLSNPKEYKGAQWVLTIAFTAASLGCFFFGLVWFASAANAQGWVIGIALLCLWATYLAFANQRRRFEGAILGLLGAFMLSFAVNWM